MEAKIFHRSINRKDHNDNRALIILILSVFSSHLEKLH